MNGNIFDKKDNKIGMWELLAKQSSYPNIKMSFNCSNINKEKFEAAIDRITEDLSIHYPNVKNTKKMKISISLENKVNDIAKNSFNNHKKNISEVIVKSPNLVKRIETIKTNKINENKTDYLPPIPSSSQVLPKKDYSIPLKLRRNTRDQQLRQQQNRHSY